MRGDRTLAAIQLLDHRLFADRHALFFQLFLCERADLGIFDWQDAVHHLNHSRVRAQRVVEAGKFDPNRPRPDDQKLLRHPLWHQSVLVRPDQITIRLKPRQFPRAGACGEDDVWGG